jgi:glutaconate CoA-transferase subunit A
MTLYRRPLALVRELLRSGASDLTLMSFTSGLESDLLVGAGRVSTVRTCYFGLEIFGLAPMFTQKASHGLKIIEETESTLAQGFGAKLARLGFLPIQGLLGTDILSVRPDLKIVTCPYTGQRHVAVPALEPDLALIHAPMADEDGNVVLGGNLALDREVAQLAKRTIISVDRIVKRSELPEGGVDLPAGGRDVTLVHAPGGAWPSSCYPDYPLDGAAVLAYVACAGMGAFERYLSAFIEGRPAVESLVGEMSKMLGEVTK